MQDYWKRIFNLARRSGDRLIVTDLEGSQPCVVMDLDSYEHLLESKREKESSSFTPEIFSKGNSEKETLCIWDTIPEARDPAQTWNISALSEQEQKQVKTVFEKTSQISNKEREIVQENGATLQQQSPSLTSSDFPLPSFIDPNVVQVNTDKNITIEEDQFYLEPIE